MFSVKHKVVERILTILKILIIIIRIHIREMLQSMTSFLS